MVAKSPALNMSLYEILDVVQGNTFRAAFLSLLIYSLYFARRDSFTITLCLMCILSMIHMVLDSLMLSWSDSGYDKLVMHTWYLFFAATDFAFVFCAFGLVDRYRIPMQKASTLIVMAFLVMGFIQVARYADRIVIKSDVLGSFYAASIPAINSCVTVAILVYSIGAVWMHRSNKTKEK